MVAGEDAILVVCNRLSKITHFVATIEGKTLREIIVKIGLERIDMQEGIMVEALLNSETTGLVMSSEFARKQGFKLERLMNMRNMDRSVTNFIQLVSPQQVDRFSQTKLCWKAPNEGYPHIYKMYKSNNK